MTSKRYQAFISYKHGGLPLAARLANALRRYAKPLYSISTSIFRDEDHLVPGSNLSLLIRKALDDSEFLILLASPEAASSIWVREELQHWCETLQRGDRLIIVLTAGQVALKPDNSGIDWDKTDALPRLRAKAADEARPEQQVDLITAVPLYIDMRWARTEAECDLANADFKKVVNRISAKLRGIEPHAMLGEEVLQTRRNTRWRNALIATVMAFGVAAIWSAVVAEVARRGTVQANKRLELSLANETSAKNEARRERDRAHESEENANDSAAKARAAETTARAAEATAKDAQAAAEAAAEKEELQRKKAEESARRATSLRLASESDLAQQRMYPSDLPLAIEAVETAPTPQAERTLRRALQRPHASAVFAANDERARLIALSPDGRLALSQGNELELWDVPNERPIDRAWAPLGAVSVTPDWAALSPARPGVLGRLPVTEVPPLPQVKPDRERQVAVAFTTHGFRSLTLDATGRGYIRGRDGEQRAVIEGLPSEPTAAAWSPDGALVAVAEGAETRLWNGETGDSVPALPKLEFATVSAITFGPDGLIALGASDGQVHMWQPGGVPLPPIHTAGGEVSCVAFAANGDVAIGSQDGSVRVRTAASSDLRVFEPYQRSISSVAFSADSKHLLVSSNDGMGSIWPLSPATELLSSPDIVGAEFAAVSDDGSTLAVATRRCASAWRLLSGQRIGFPLCVRDSAIVAVGFVGNEPVAISATRAGLGRRSITNQAKQATYDRSEGPLAVVLNPQGVLAATLKSGGTRFWPERGGESIFQLEETGSFMAFSRDGRRLALGDSGGVSLCEVGAAQARCPSHFDFVGGATSLALSPSGDQVAIGNEDGGVEIRPWTGGLSRTMPSAHEGKVRSLGFSDDESWLVSAAEDATVRSWRIGSQEVAVVQDDIPLGRRERPDGTLFKEWGIKPEAKAIAFASFSTDARRILTVSASGTVQAQFRALEDVVGFARCALRPQLRQRLNFACDPALKTPWTLADQRAAGTGAKVALTSENQNAAKSLDVGGLP